MFLYVDCIRKTRTDMYSHLELRIAPSGDRVIGRNETQQRQDKTRIAPGVAATADFAVNGWLR